MINHSKDLFVAISRRSSKPLENGFRVVGCKIFIIGAYGLLCIRTKRHEPSWGYWNRFPNVP